MLRKYGKFYADWKDDKGRRRRKAFPTKFGAARYQAKMQGEVIAKKAPRSAASGPSAKRG